MNSGAQSSWVARCRQLKKEGMTVRGISEKLHVPRTTVGRYVKGMADQREIRDIQTRTVCPTNPTNEVGNTGHTDQDAMSHLSHLSHSKVTNRDQDSMSHKSHLSHSRGSVGVYILLFLLLAILILILLDRFVFEGKIFAWVFGQLKPEDHSQVTEQKVPLIGFEGRSLDDI